MTTLLYNYFVVTKIILHSVLKPRLENITPIFLAKLPLKSTNCLSLDFLGNPPSILVFRDPLPKTQIFSVKPQNIKVFHP